MKIKKLYKVLFIYKRDYYFQVIKTDLLISKFKS